MPQAPVVQTLYSAIRQAPVGQTLDSAIHRTNHFREDKASITEINCAIRWIVIYPEDSANQRLNNWGQINPYPVDKYLGNQLCYPLNSDLSSGKHCPPFE